MVSMMTENDLLELAARCVRGELPIWDFAETLAHARNVKINVVMFGDKCVDSMKARSLLHEAHMAAVRSWDQQEAARTREKTSRPFPPSVLK